MTAENAVPNGALISALRTAPLPRPSRAGEGDSPIGGGLKAACGDHVIQMEVVTVAGRAMPIEFRVFVNTVEVWAPRGCRGTFDREVLLGWLHRPGAPLICMDRSAGQPDEGEASFTVDRNLGSAARVSLSLPDVAAWALSPSALEKIRGAL